MAQLVKALSHKQDLGLDPQNPHKKPEAVVCASNLSPGDWEGGKQAES